MVYMFGNYTLDIQRCGLRHGTQWCKVGLPVVEALVYLVKHRDRIVTKDELLEHLWPGLFVADDALTTRIKDARKAIGDTGRGQHSIRTFRNLGYRFVAEVDEDVLPAPEEHNKHTVVIPTDTKTDRQRIREKIKNKYDRAIHVPSLAATITVALDLVRDECESLNKKGKMVKIKEDRYRVVVNNEA